MTLWELRGIVIDVLNLHDDQPLAGATGAATTTPPIVRGRHIELIRHLGFVHEANQGDDARLGVYVEGAF